MTELDPDQLLKSLDAGIAAARFRRSNSGASRDAVRMAGILILVLGTAVALFALQYVASEISSSKPAPKTQLAGGETK